MYGHAHGQRLVYTCGKYMATGGSDCGNNTVDAEAILRFTLDTLSELIYRLGVREKLRKKLLKRALSEQPEDPIGQQHNPQRAHLQTTISKLEKDLEIARRNWGTEENPKYREELRIVVDRIHTELDVAKDQLAAIPESPTVIKQSPPEEVERALHLLEDIRRVSDDPAARSQIPPLMQRLGLRIGLQLLTA